MPRFGADLGIEMQVEEDAETTNASGTVAVGVVAVCTDGEAPSGEDQWRRPGCFGHALQPHVYFIGDFRTCSQGSHRHVRCKMC